MELQAKASGLAVLAALLSLAMTGLLAMDIKAGGSSASGRTAPQPAVLPTEGAAAAKSIEQGHHFFEMSCSECHGDDAHGDEGPDLHNLAFSNARIVSTIRKGIKGEMPSFAKKYDEAQAAALVSYLRTLR